MRRPTGTRAPSPLRGLSLATLSTTCWPDSVATRGGVPTIGHSLLFNAAFGEGDLDAALDLVTEDIVFGSTSPAPDGQRVEGRDAVREAWTDVMRTPGMSFTEEESFVSGDRAVVRWRYAWGGPDPGHVRGVDVIRFRDGLVCEKLSYVKG